MEPRGKDSCLLLNLLAMGLGSDMGRRSKQILQLGLFINIVRRRIPMTKNMVSRRGRKLRSDIVPKSRELGFFFP